ncbi:hypothetical protein E2C01_069276 [Portunus trituberculatus]|uniref:Uncharacterized protein n=1 Tax=Portunus trituberculatus TaxID=210409 RepID=A0A5B7HYX9_PORTR|nr:hypothetical protein [Portunus trituberculatus]
MVRFDSLRLVCFGSKTRILCVNFNFHLHLLPTKLSDPSWRRLQLSSDKKEEEEEEREDEIGRTEEERVKKKSG